MAMQGSGTIVPGYSYNYPSQSVRLAGVKHDIFNPRLPRIRQMDRDTEMHRLADEHCRTSTTLGPGEFMKASSMSVNHLKLLQSQSSFSSFLCVFLSLPAVRDFWGQLTIYKRRFTTLGIGSTVAGSILSLGFTFPIIRLGSRL